MRVLFIGGTGDISTSTSQLAVERGIDLVLLHRGQTPADIPGAAHIQGDIHQPEQVRQALDGMHFDAVVNWVAYVPEDIERDIALFRGLTDQYVFISSASAYQKPAVTPVITESTPLHNPFWRYSRNKAACEARLMAAYDAQEFPVTIVRPSHTYAKRIPGIMGGAYFLAERMLRGLPVIVHGDGTSLWTLTHSEDFARGFVGLLGNPHALGHAVHITSDELLNWNQIHEIVGHALGVTPKIVHIPSDFIARVNPNMGPGLLGDKSWSVIFDNSKIRRLVPEYQATIPFHRGIEKVLAWFNEDETRKAVDPAAHAEADAILAAYEAATRPAAAADAGGA